jgi:hypothetical protein
MHHFVFCYTSWHFIRFPELTYWRDAIVPVPCFLLFLHFRKVTREIFSELDETKPEPPIFPGRKTNTKGESERGQGPTTPGGGAPPGLRHHMVWGLGPPLTSPLHLFKASIMKILNQSAFYQKKVLQHLRHQRPISGDRSLCSGTLPGRGSAPGAISIDFTAISIDVAVSHDEEGVVLPRGWGIYR